MLYIVITIHYRSVWKNVIVLVLNLQREAFNNRYPPDCFVLLG